VSTTVIGSNISSQSKIKEESKENRGRSANNSTITGFINQEKNLINLQNLNLKQRNETVKPKEDHIKDNKNNSNFNKILQNFKTCGGDFTKLKNTIKSNKPVIGSSLTGERSDRSKIYEMQNYIKQTNQRLESFLFNLPLSNRLSVGNLSCNLQTEADSQVNSKNQNNLFHSNEESNNNEENEVYLESDENLDMCNSFVSCPEIIKENSLMFSNQKTVKSSEIVSSTDKSVLETNTEKTNKTINNSKSFNSIIMLEKHSVPSKKTEGRKNYSYGNSLQELEEERQKSDYKSCNSSISIQRFRCSEHMELENENESNNDQENLFNLNDNMENIHNHFDTILKSAAKVKQLEQDNNDKDNNLEEKEKLINNLEESDNKLRIELETLKNQMNEMIKEKEKEIIKVNSLNSSLILSQASMHVSIKELMSELELSELHRKKLHNYIQELRGNIRVYCRVKPITNQVCIKFLYNNLLIISF